MGPPSLPRLLRRWPLLSAVLLLLLWRLPKAPKIQRPCLGMPAIHRSGETFTAELDSPFWPWLKPRWSLEREGREVALEGPSRSGFFSTASELELPSDLAPGAYALVARSVAGQHRRASAVHVLAPGQAERDLRVVHLADLPILNEEQGYQDWLQVLSEIALWRPDAVLVGGDIAYTGRPLAYQRLEAGLLGLDLPVIVALGNHEFEGLKGFTDRFGPPWHRVDLGAYTVLTLATLHGRDQFNALQLDWLEEQLDQLGDRPVLVQMHHPFWGENQIHRGRERYLNLLKRQGVKLVLSGDVHYDHGFDQAGQALPLEVEGGLPAGVLFLCTTSAGRHVRAGGPFVSWPGFRVIELIGRELTWVGFDQDQDGRQEPMRSVPWGAGAPPAQGRARALSEQAAERAALMRLPGAEGQR